HAETPPAQRRSQPPPPPRYPRRCRQTSRTSFTSTPDQPRARSITAAGSTPDASSFDAASADAPNERGSTDAQVVSTRRSATSPPFTSVSAIATAWANPSPNATWAPRTRPTSESNATESDSADGGVAVEAPIRCGGNPDTAEARPVSTDANSA